MEINAVLTAIIATLAPTFARLTPAHATVEPQWLQEQQHVQSINLMFAQVVTKGTC
jgi:hypothetical protein